MTTDGISVESLHQTTPIMIALKRHWQTRHEISCIVAIHDEFEQSGRDCSQLEERLVAAIGAEQSARMAVLQIPVANIQDVAAKADHMHSLLLEGDEALDRSELGMLLRSLIRGDQPSQFD